MDVEVALVRWPNDRERRAEFGVDRPILFIVESGPPPDSPSLVEDWVRVPTSKADLELRIDALRRRWRQLAGLGVLDGLARDPVLEETGILRFGGGWVALSPLEARLVGAMITRLGAVVTRQGLTEAGWPRTEGGRPDPHRNTLDAHVLRLRQRLPAIGLTIRTIRSRGYLLEPVNPTRM